MNASSHQQTDTVKIPVLLSHLLRNILTFFLEVIGLYQEKSPKKSTHIDMLNHVDPAQPPKTSPSTFAPSRPKTTLPTSKPPAKSKLSLVLQNNAESTIMEQRPPHSLFLSAPQRLRVTHFLSARKNPNQSTGPPVSTRPSLPRSVQSA